MGADIYLTSEHKRRADEVKLEDKRDAYFNAEHAQSFNQRDERTRLEKEYRAAIEYAEDGTAFRDSYNSSNLAWLCGLSYWKDGNLRDEEGYFPVEEIKRWLGIIKGTNIRNAVIDAIANGVANGGALGGKPLEERRRPELYLADDETLDDTVKYFEKKQACFVALLEKAIELDEPLYWSV